MDEVFEEMVEEESLEEPLDGEEDDPVEAAKPDGEVSTSTVVFRLNGAPLELPVKEDQSPYYLMDLIQYSGIDLEHPRGVVKLMVNGMPGMFQQALRAVDTVRIEEEKR